MADGSERLRERVESLVNRMDTGFAQLRGDIGRLERKLDRFIDVFQPKPPDPA